MTDALNEAIRSIESNDVDGLIAALPLVESVNARIDRDETLLHLAARFGNPRVVTLLLTPHADIEALNVEGESPLIVAIEEDHAEVVRLLLQAGAQMSYSFQRHQTETERREIIRRREELRQRLKSEEERAKLATVLNLILPRLDRPDEEFFRPPQTVEMNAVDCCYDFNVLRVLVEEFNADLNHRSAHDDWPLWRFAHVDDLQAVRWLLLNGANVDQSWGGGTALFAALQTDNLEMIRLLLESGANVDHRNDDDELVPLHFSRSVAAAQLLLDHGADPTLRDQFGRPCWEFINDSATREMLESAARSFRAMP